MAIRGILENKCLDTIFKKIDINILLRTMSGSSKTGNAALPVDTTDATKIRPLGYYIVDGDEVYSGIYRTSGGKLLAPIFKVNVYGGYAWMNIDFYTIDGESIAGTQYPESVTVLYYVDE